MKKATKVFTNGNVITMIGEHEVCEALAIIDEQILAVGGNEEIKVLVNEGTEVIDLRGKTIIPGCYGPYGHIPIAELVNGDLTNQSLIEQVFGGDGLENRHISAIGKMSQRYSALGITTANDVAIRSMEEFKWYQHAAEQGLLQIRVVLQIDHQMMDDIEELNPSHRLLELGGIVFMHQSSAWGVDGDRVDEKEYRTAFIQDFLECYKRGLQVSVYCDDEITLGDFLYALEVAHQLYPTTGERALLLYRQPLGEEQLEVLQEYEVNVKIGNDISLAEQCQSTYDGLRAHTVNAAYQYFQEKEKGTLEEGKLADLAILSINPLECSQDELGQIEVVGTMVGGNMVYRKHSLFQDMGNKVTAIGG